MDPTMPPPDPYDTARRMLALARELADAVEAILDAQPPAQEPQS